MARNFNQSNTDYLDGSFTWTSGFPFTGCAWFRDTNGGNNDRNIFQVQDSTQSDRYFRMGRDFSSNALTCLSRWDVGSVGAPVTTTTYTTSQWHHGIMEAASATSRTIWLDNAGSASSTTSDGTPIGIDSVTIGRENDSSPDDPWDGDIAEVAFWSATLTAGERAALAEGFSPLFIRPSALVFYAPLLPKTGNDVDIKGGVILTDTNTVGSAEHLDIIYPEDTVIHYPSVAAVSGAKLQGSLSMIGVGI